MSLVGKNLGPYRVTALVGQGAMAAVYRAEHAALGREVALKVPHMSTRLAHEDIARFRREGRLLATIQHPGVIQILDADEVDGVPFLAMTFVEAPTLEAVLAACPEGKLAEKRVVAVAMSLLEALEAIHAKGVLHRDLKPSNVFVETEDRAILADFGVARPMGEHTMITADGGAVGTFLYMAPEQHAEQAVDPRTDLYMTGLLMYRALCGKLPFEGNMVQIVSAKCEHDHLESPRVFAPEVSVGLETVLRRACARKPDERFATAAEFRGALKALSAKASSTGANARPPTPRRGAVTTKDLPSVARRTRGRRRWPAVLLVLGAFGVGALLAVLAFRSDGAAVPWVALPDASHEGASAAPPVPRRAPPRPRPPHAALDLGQAQGQLAALWPGYVPTALEADLTRFPLISKNSDPAREQTARTLLARLGNTLGGAIMRELADRALVFPAFLPYMVPGAPAPAMGSFKVTGGGSEGLLDEPLYDVVGKSTPQTALAMFLACTARVADYLVNVRVGRRPPDGVTMIDLLAFVSYLAMAQPGFHSGAGEPIYVLFQPTREGDRQGFENGSPDKVAARARQIDALCAAFFQQRGAR